MAADPPFEALCRTARTVFDVPAAAVCLEGGDGGWIALADGADRGVWAFATTLEGRPDRVAAVLVVPDLRRSEASATLPYVAGAPGLRFMASAPFGAAATGRLAIFDTRPRDLGAAEIGALRDLAQIAGHSLDMLRRAAEAEAREADFRLLAESSTDTIVRGNLDGVRLYISPSVRELLGYEPEELIGRRAAEITYPDDLESLRQLIGQVRDGRIGPGLCELRQCHKDGTWVWMEASIRLTRSPATGLPDGYVTSVRGIDRRKRIEARLAYLASHDELTGLPNRKLLRERLDGRIAEVRRSGRRFAVMCADIDRFKLVNDELGHQAGDAVLREAARRMRAVVPDDDTVARVGGDEFAALLGDAVDPAALAARLVAAMAEPLAYEGGTIAVGLSIGVACAPECGLDPDHLMAAADRALYRAKAAGRNTFRLSGPPDG